MPEPNSSPQEAFVQLEAYQRQLEVAARQVELIQNALDEATRAKRSLEALDEEKSGEILLPLGASTFLRGSVANRDTAITGIGAGYATERPRAKAIENLAEREKSLKEEMDHMMQAAFQLQQEIARLQELVDERGDADAA
ncbi:MAG: prefoldin subunit alpha [Euryarchaeota archaeon]|nr:prefoldin subunit alpha [Euryarchaeota archaeon]